MILFYAYSDQKSDGEEFWVEEGNKQSDDGMLMVPRDPPATDAPVPREFPACTEYASAQLLLKWVAGFLFILQAKHHIPNAAIDFLIKFLFLLVCVLGRFSPFVHHFQQSL